MGQRLAVGHAARVRGSDLITFPVLYLFLVVLQLITRRIKQCSLSICIKKAELV